MRAIPALRVASIAVILTTSVAAQADPSKLTDCLDAYEKASNELVILHHRSIALHKEIEGTAKFKGRLRARPGPHRRALL